MKVNTGARVAAITDAKRALDFIYKLDSERYRSMLAKMRNNALNMDDNAYPQSLSAAYRIASVWLSEDFDRGFNGAETHSAFVFENTDTPPTKKTPTTKPDKKKPNLKTKKGANGHYARDCTKRKGKAVAFIADHTADLSDDDGRSLRRGSLCHVH